MKKSILLLTLLTLVSSAFAAETKTDFNSAKKTEIKETKETSKDERLEDMMKRYQGE